MNHTIYFAYKGEQKSIRELSKISGIKYRTIQNRIYINKMSAEDALALPVKQYKTKRKSNRQIRIDRAIESWYELMVARYGEDYRSRFRMQSYRECGRHYREFISRQLMVA